MAYQYDALSPLCNLAAASLFSSTVSSFFPHFMHIGVVKTRHFNGEFL